jgi:hypothetical protein
MAPRHCLWDLDTVHHFRFLLTKAPLTREFGRAQTRTHGSVTSCGHLTRLKGSSCGMVLQLATHGNHSHGAYNLQPALVRSSTPHQEVCGAATTCTATQEREDCTVVLNGLAALPRWLHRPVCLVRPSSPWICLHQGRAFQCLQSRLCVREARDRPLPGFTMDVKVGATEGPVS